MTLPCVRILFVLIFARFWRFYLLLDDSYRITPLKGNLVSVILTVPVVHVREKTDFCLPWKRG